MRAWLLAVAAAVAAGQELPKREILAEFNELLRIPNTAGDAAGLRRNAEWIRAALARRGVAARLLEVSGAVPAVYGSLEAAGAKQTVVFYAHYDGQMVDASKWEGSGPFEPSLRGGKLEDPEARLYARAASDDKAPIIAMLAALDEMKRRGERPSINVKFLFEGEEESGSKNLRRILEANKELLRADLWLICDGPVEQTRRMQLYFGARGVTAFNLTVYGPRRELHSGHYGNWAPNPAMMLARLLASFKDDDGRVLIRGFYDGVEALGPAEIAALKEAPEIDGQLKLELWLGRTESGGKRLAESIQSPSFNVRGVESAAVGAASRNVVPAQAMVSVDIRLVKGNDPARMLELVRAHIREQGFFLVEGREPSEDERMNHAKVARFDASEGGYRAVRTRLDSPEARQVIAAVERARGAVVKMPALGGSVPLAFIEDVYPVPLIGVPIVNHDNNQHSHNENLRLQNLWDGVKTMGALMRMGR